MQESVSFRSSVSEPWVRYNETMALRYYDLSLHLSPQLPFQNRNEETKFCERSKVAKVERDFS